MAHLNETNCSSSTISNYWSYMIENPLTQQSVPVGVWVRLIEIPLVLALGLSGNTLVFIVMQKPSLRKQSFSRYLSLLAVCDSMSLLVRLLVWINLLCIQLKHEIVVTFHTDVLCALSEYIITANHVFCSWLLVCITFERIIVTSFPLSAVKLCTPRIANTVLVGLVVTVFLLFSYVLYFSKFSCNTCGMQQKPIKVHYTIATTFVTMLPLILIIISNIWIVCSLHRKSGFVKNRQRDDNRNRITKMLLVLSISFVVLFLPNAMLVLIMQLRPDWNSTLSVALGPVNIMWDMNYGINFYLYAITGKIVRTEVKAMFHCLNNVMTFEPKRDMAEQQEHIPSPSVTTIEIQINSIGNVSS